MKSFLLGALCFLSMLTCHGQEQYTISGYVKDARNGEALIGATVSVNENSSGTISNVYGFYSITLPEGIYNIDYRYIGYASVLNKIELKRNLRLDVELVLGEERLDEVIITDKAIDDNVQNIEMSVAKLDIEAIEKTSRFCRRSGYY